ncbi:Ig-like domain-containing protein [Bdellovibrio sp. SKB1291214]|uniref:LamG-like jellyroll fold domain-containing protein n=1 Tax=Bdellovibrio sp. SKB1291214 TaxID=1732569 RepID=UPI00223ECD00|nr:LamG-like jellyroll fold domain-containing protein [Bdellovibrio sp. SKB1291214]UYL09156.1 Ig-like domain-containing protein [Bdellovibrio sp. SKB1291214]
MMKWLLILTTAFTFTACTKKGSSIEDGFLAGVSISAGASTIEIATSTLISGNSTTVTLTTRDSEGNIFHVPGSNPDVQFKTSGGTSTGIFSSVTNHGDGTYTATFSGAVAGSQTTIGATINGQGLSSTNAKVTVLPANYSAANSYVSLSATTVASRSTITATFYAMDATNTQLPGGGLAVSFNIASGTSTGTFGATTDNGDGSYTAVFTGKLVGTAASVSASVAGIPISSTLPTVTVTPGTASAIAVNAGNNQSAVVNNALGSSLKVKVTDAEGNVVPSAQIDWTTTGNSSLGSATDNTDSAGISANTLTVGTVTGSYTVTAKIHGTTTTATFTATATPGAINNFLLSGVPSSATAGTAFTTTITARDSYNNVKTDYTGTIQFSSSDSGSPTLPANYTYVVGDAGVKQFSFNLKTTGNQTITATQSGGSPTVTSSAIAVSAATISQLAIITGPTTTVAGSSISTIVVRALDAYSNTATSFTGNITLAIGTNAGSGTLSGTKTVAATAGSASFSAVSIDKVGTGYTLVASASGATSATSLTFNITPAAGSTIAISSGNNQSAVVNTALGTILVAVVRDAYGNLAPNSDVDWTSSAGTLGSATTTSNSSGLASNSITLGTVTGAHTITATVNGTSSSVNFTATATPGAIDNFILSGVPTSATAGTSFTTTVTARDSYNNVKTDYTGVIQFTSSDPNSPTLPSNYTFVSGDAGTKQFSFTLKTTGGHTITATQVSGGSPTVTSSNISVSAAAISQLLFIAEPSNTVAGSTISTVTVRALDAYANTASSFTGNITLAIGTNAGSGTLSGTKTVAATAGTANFTDLSIEKSGTGYTLSATASGASAKISSTFNITPDAPASIAVSSGNNQSGTISTALGSSLVAVVKDAYGNNVPSTTVNWSTTAGTLGSASSTSNSSGLASNTLTLSSTTGAHTVTATVDGTAFSTTFTETATNGPASQLSFSTQPVGGVTPGTALATQPVVRILDASGNLVTTGADATATVSLSLTTGTGALGGTTSLSAVGGVATFTNVNATVYGTGKVMTATKSGTIMSGGVGSLTQTSNSFDITQASPTAFTISSVSVVEADKLRVSWGASTNANSYTVKYGTSAGNYTTTASTSATSPFDITGLTGGTTYYIMVTAVNSATSVDATSEAMGIPISAFTLTSLTPGTGSSSLAFASAAGATTYDVLYDTSSHTASQTYASTTTSVTSPATTSSLSAGTTYYYRVRANNSFGSLVSTNELSGAVYQNFTLSIPFTAGTESSYSISNTTGTALSGGYALLKKSPQTDSSSTDFPASGMTSVQWDSTKNVVRLSATANTSSFDSSWTPAWSNMVAYYKFDGNLNDSIGSNNLTMTGTAAYPTGKVGSALTVDASNYATVNNINLFNSSYSISSWVYITSTANSNRPIVSYGTSAANAGFFYGPFGSLYENFTVNDSTGNTVISPLTYAVSDRNRWVHFLVTYNASNKLKTMYRDGLFLNQASSSADISTTNGTMYIGRNYNGDAMIGQIDEVGIWNTALTQTQAAAIYNAQVGKYTGKFNSRIMDAQAYGSTDTSWTALTFKTSLPFGKELSEGTESSTYYPSVATALNTSLKGLWHFNEASYNGTAGEVKDAMGISHGTRSGSGTAINTNRSKFNYSVGFDNRDSTTNYNNYISAGASNTFIASDNQALTISGWVFANYLDNTGATTIDNRLVTLHRGSPGETLGFGFGQNGKLMVYSYNDGTPLYVSSSTAISKYVWTHVAMTFDGTCFQLYLNGEASGTCINGKLNAASSTPIYFGTIDTTVAGRYRGLLDEVGIWSRALSVNEMRELYRRTSNRIKYQVRSCSQSDCSDQNAVSGLGWKGPDNSVDTYFSENYNKANNSLTGANLGTTASMTFSNFAGFSVTSNRYFQYRAFFESDDASTNCTYNSTATYCSPELVSVTAGPDRYDNTIPTFTTTGAGVTSAFQTLDSNGFTETLGTNGCSAGAKYALSSNGTNYYYYNGTSWAASSDYSTASTAAQINAGISTFVATAGTGTLRVKSFLKSSATTQCEIDNLQITGKKY